MDYQIEVLAEAIAADQGGAEVNEADRAWARDLLMYLNDHGWSIVKTNTIYMDTNVLAEDGPIQRALGLDRGD